jgi:pSer/pThr/pTyr-binding forkhead associated (FHA) protein
VCLTSDPPAEYRVGSSALLIGRSPHCDIRITTHFVSREHARILRDRQQVLIEDLGSKNGVFVNAVRVERGALRHGDLVTIGETQFRFELEPSAEAVRA